MRILLAQNSLYYPAHGGGDKSNRLLMEALARRGHDCRVVARISDFGELGRRRLLEQLAARSVAVDASAPGVTAFELHGVEARVVTDHPNLRGYFTSQIFEFRPAVIVTSTDDPAQMLLEAALRSGGVRVVYLARATLALPFGPDCAFPSEEKTERLRRAGGVVGVSRYVADYIRRWSGIEAVHFPISLMDGGPYRELGRFENEFVTMVNPCAVKGISIFLALAERLPEARFAAVPMWGTNEADRATLARLPNVELLQPVDDIDELLARTKVLLVPSLWAEARSRIVVEAMLRGVPVIASNVGGIPEAKMGVDYLLPVRPIEKYRPRLDDQMVPVAEVPEQDIGPWEVALRKLLSGRGHYEEISKASREAALRYVSGLSVEPFEKFLREVARSPRRAAAASERAAGAPVHGKPAVLDKLSPEKRRLLALRLKKKEPVSQLWFPCPPETSAALRLFCFPYAGAGASVFRGWNEKLPETISVCPVRLPGRENRLSETPFRAMGPLIDALAGVIQPYLNVPFAFFGHSMGAGLSFELARALRSRGLPGPAGLFVSGARAPQLRRGVAPPLPDSENELLDKLERLEGIPREVRENEELLRVVLPALRADTELYRGYVYSDGPPLECPVHAYGGEDDPNVRPEHLEAWKEQTAASYSLRLFPGGHFYVQSAQEAFLEALGRDLGQAAARTRAP